MTTTPAGAVTDEAALVDARLDELLAGHDPRQASRSSFRARQFELGLAWVWFPAGRGGLGVAASHQRTVDARLRAAGARAAGLLDAFGHTMAAPTLLRHASEELLDRLLEPAFTREQVWCQLFSEPGAGSDLAGLATRARREGADWIVSGQKVWNTNAHEADRGLLICRTDPDVPKHRGLTYFALDMHAPGVTVRPLRQMTGEAEFNEVFLDDVRIPDSDRVGAVGEGWGVAMTTLANERTTIGRGSGRAERGSGSIAEAVRIWNDTPGTHDPAELDELIRLWVAAEVLRLSNARAGQLRSAGTSGPDGSLRKVMFAELNKHVYEFCIDLLGANGLVDYDYELKRTEPSGLVGPPGSARRMFLRSRANSIEGGTSEIQRNIIGERVLGLPGEPRVDKDRPWSEVPNR